MSMTYKELFEEAATSKGDGASIKDASEAPDGEVANPMEGSNTENDEGNDAEGEILELQANDEDGNNVKSSDSESIDAKYKSLQGMFESAISKNKELEEKVSKLLSTIENISKEPEPKEEVKKDYQEEKDEDLDKYLTEMDYIHKNELKLRKKEYKSLKEEILREIADKYDISIKSAEKMISDKIEADGANHIMAIESAHPEYGREFNYSDVKLWIDSMKSKSAKKVMIEVMENGDTEEVIELLNLYKDDKYHKGVVGDSDKTDNTYKQNEEIKRKKIKEMEVVRGKKSPIGDSATPKSINYESAFNEAISKKR